MDNRISSLTPAAQAIAQKFISEAAAAGVPIKITSTLRTAAEQDALYAQGRTKPGAIVTNLKGGQSIHETGNAFDVIPENGGYHASQATWDKIGAIGESLGLEWGGKWQGFKDLPHFQLKGAKAGTPSSQSNQPTLSGVPWTGPLPASSEADNVDKTKSKSSNIYMVNAPPIPNRLHQYASYIYSLSLHMMTPEDLATITTTREYSAKNVIIASAGRHGVNFQRNKNWNTDFYFENFNLITVISPNDQSRNTNAINCDFSIIEPYGFTLIERILKTTEDLGGKNYLDMPYLVQIDFFAIDDAGEIGGAIPELQKRFPIKLNKLDIKITERGAEYKINASPQGHAAFEGSAVTVPANMEVTARTVADFFQSLEGTAADSLAQEIAAKADFQQRQKEDRATAASLYAPSLLYSSTQKNATINVDSFGTAINAYWKGLKDAGKVSIADIYRFEFLPDPETGEDVIGKATFVEDKRNTPKETPMKKNENIKDNISMRLSDVGNSQNIYDTTRGIFSINYGTAIDKLLEYVIRNSSYIHDQLVLPDGLTADEYKSRKEAMKDKPLKWFRIIPKVRLLGFDEIRGKWAKEYTYTVKPYKMYNLRSDIAPQGTVVTPVKAYNYIFTGKNNDILNLDIQFNTLYYTQQTAYRNNLEPTSPSGDSLTVKYQDQNPSSYVGPGSGIDYNVVMPLVMAPIVQNSKAVATGNPRDPKSVGAADLAESIMTSTMADMIGIKMSIIGDPDYIKQDDIFYGADALSTEILSSELDSRLLPDGGSLVMDDGGVYIQILFKIPQDIDDETGFMKYAAGERNSVFSGLYMVVQVTNNFSKGQFTQELELVRLPRQVAFDYVGNSSDNNRSNARPGTDTVSKIPVQNVTATPVPNTATQTDTAVNQTVGQDQPVAQTNANADETPAATQEQQDLAAVRASGTTTTINDQNTPQQTAPVQTPTERDINNQYVSDAKVLVTQVKDLVNQRDGAFNQAQLVNSSLNRLEDQLIAEDPANADLGPSQLAAKYPNYATLAAQKQDLLNQQKSLNAQITSVANSIVSSEPTNATISVNVNLNTNIKGPTPIITIGGQVQ